VMEDLWHYRRSVGRSSAHKPLRPDF
jgi:hypothetical protein